MSDRFTATLLVGLLLVLAALWFAQDLGSGQYVRYDGYLTLDRSGGFAKHDDWLGVYSNGTLSARKPPLQYWLTALGLQAGLDELLALRLPAFVFFLGLLAVTSWICYLLTNRNPWAAAAGFSLMVCSWVLVSHARSGMLDTGLSFFIMLSMLLLWYARHNPRAWLLCGVAMGLGALQKAPVALLLVLLASLLMALRSEPAFRFSRLTRNRYFWAGLSVGLLMLGAWPALQVAKMGPGFLEIAYTNEMLLRFNPVGEDGVGGKASSKLLRWLWEDLGVIAIISGACVAAVLAVPRWRSDSYLLAFAIIALLLLTAYLAASGAIYRRYLVVLLPFMVCVSVRVITDLARLRAGVLAVALVLVALSTRNIQDAMAQIDHDNTHANMRERVAALDNYRQPNDIVVLDKTIIFPGAYGYLGQSEPYAIHQFKNKHNLARFRRDVQLARANRRALIGLVHKKRLRAIKAVTGGVETHRIADDLVVWRYVPR